MDPMTLIATKAMGSGTEAPGFGAVTNFSLDSRRSDHVF